MIRAKVVDLTFYSMDSSISEYIRMVIQDKADQADIQLNITEINDPSLFIKDAIPSVPSIKIGNSLKSIGKKDAVNFAKESSKWVLENAKYGNLIEIVVPTDFSAASQNALEYALLISKNLNAYVTVLHVNRPEPIRDEDAGINPPISSLKEEMLDSIVEKIHASYKDIDISNTPVINKEYKNGFVADVILEKSESENTIIIMGTTGSSGTFKKVLGSVSTKVAKKSKSPVILVPPNSEKKEINKIAFCAKDINQDVKVIDDLLLFAQPEKTDLHVIHITKSDEHYRSIDLLNILKNRLPQNKIRFEEIHEKPSPHIINQYVNERDIDLIAISTKERKKLENLLHKSFTYQMAIETSTPLLILHTKNNDQ